MERCSASLVIRQVQIKTRATAYTKKDSCIKNRKITSGGKRMDRGCGEIRTFVHCWWECKLVQPLWKTVWQFINKLNIELLYDPVIPLLGIYPKDLKTGTRTDTVHKWS